MANTLSDAASLYDEPQFRRLVMAALVQQAVAVRTEDPATPNHDQRSAYALLVLSNPEGYVNTFLRILSTVSSILTAYSPTTHSMPSDATIISVVQAAWNNLAVS